MSILKGADFSVTSTQLPTETRRMDGLYKKEKSLHAKAELISESSRKKISIILIGDFT